MNVSCIQAHAKQVHTMLIKPFSDRWICQCCTPPAMCFMLSMAELTEASYKGFWCSKWTGKLLVQTKDYGVKKNDQSDRWQGGTVWEGCGRTCHQVTAGCAPLDGTSSWAATVKCVRWKLAKVRDRETSHSNRHQRGNGISVIFLKKDWKRLKNESSKIRFSDEKIDTSSHSETLTLGFPLIQWVYMLDPIEHK